MKEILSEEIFIFIWGSPPGIVAPENTIWFNILDSVQYDSEEECYTKRGFEATVHLKA